MVLSPAEHPLQRIDAHRLTDVRHLRGDVDVPRAQMDVGSTCLVLETQMRVF